MRFLLANLEGRGEDALDYVRGALRDGLPIADIQDHILSPAQREAGRMWLMAEIPIADEHYGTAIVERALGILQESVPRPKPGARVVMTMGVAGNMHDLGLRVIGQRLQLWRITRNTDKTWFEDGCTAYLTSVLRNTKQCFTLFQTK